MIECSHIWGKGQLMAFSGLDGQTDYQHGLVLRTDDEKYVLDIRQPETSGNAIRYIGKPVKNVSLTSDSLVLESEDENSILVFADAWNILLQGAWCFESKSEKLQSKNNGTCRLVATHDHLHESFLEKSVSEVLEQRKHYLQQITLPDLPAEFRGAANKAVSMLKGQIYAPEGQIPCLWSTPDRWPHANMWNWDSAFHALGMRHLNPAVARQMLNAVFATQREDGFIAHMMTPYLVSEITQPPILGLAIAKVNEKQPSPEWIAELAPKLAKYLEWIMANRDKDNDGLLEWKPDQHSPHGSDESGMDNSPRFDGPMTLAAMDFNAYLAHECEIMATFQPERHDYWMAHHKRICDGLNAYCWNDKLGLYVDYDTQKKQQSDVMSSAGFLPLLCGAASPEQAERMRQHLHNPNTFGTAFRVPSIAACNVAAYKKDMWRGPVWVNINYLISLGLERYGFATDARELQLETCREEARYYEQFGTFFEYYDDKGIDAPPQLLRKSDVPPYDGWETYAQVMFDYGWSGTLYLEMIHTLFSKK